MKPLKAVVVGLGILALPVVPAAHADTADLSAQNARYIAVPGFIDPGNDRGIWVLDTRFGRLSFCQARAGSHPHFTEKTDIRCTDWQPVGSATPKPGE